MQSLLSNFGLQVAVASTAEEGLERALQLSPAVIVTDLNMPGHDGLWLISELREASLEATIIVLTGHATIETAIEATRRGVYDYLQKPVRPDHLEHVIQRALERSQLRSEVRELRQEVLRGGRFHRLVGKSRSMLEQYRLIEQVGPSEASVLITGESGTGKEMVARTIHELSGRKDSRLVAINCAAIPETLLESEILGHEKGAFTGANQSRPGCFEQADGGTLLLDEIGEMPVALQSKLLRVLEDGKVQRLGGTEEVSVDTRVIASTNADIEGALERGEFREDLYYRLNVFHIQLPPLRERKLDIPLLADHFLSGFSDSGQTEATGFSEDAIALLLRHDWPGNARELRNVVQRASILCKEGDIEPHHLPPSVRPKAGKSSGEPGTLMLSVGTTVEEAEKALILETLDVCKGVKTRAASMLGISTRTLYTKLHKYEEEGAYAPDPGDEESE